MEEFEKNSCSILNQEKISCTTFSVQKIISAMFISMGRILVLTKYLNPPQRPINGLTLNY